jgi:hypothetical protein
VIIVLLLHAFSEWKESVVSLIVFITTIGVIHLYIGEDIRRFNIVVKMIVFTLVLSTLVLIVGQINPALNLQIRSIILDHTSFRTNNVTGLTSEVFHFGYQASALTGIAIAYVTYQKHIKNKLLVYILFFISLFAIFLGMQRAVVFSIFLYLLFIIREGRIRYIIYFITFIVFLWSLGLFDQLLAGKTIFYKIVSNTDKMGWGRLFIQIETVQLLFQYPFGIWVKGLSLDQIMSNHPGYLGYFNISPHNAYLVYMLEMGIPFMLVIGYILFSTFRAIKNVIYLKDFSTVGIGCKAIAFALIGLLSVALFHHPSLFDSSALTVLIYVLFWHIYNLRYNKMNRIST